MAAYKDEERGTWYVSFHYTDWTDANKRKMKRGFATRKDALEWEHHFIAQQSENMDMTFGDFVVIYLEDMEKRLRESTMISKRYIINLKILPYFKDKKISEISAPDIRKWQTEIMKGNYAKTYLRSIQEQLSAIFNYAVKYFDLRKNPCHVAGGMGKHTADEMDFWTLEEFQQFIETMMNKAAFGRLFLNLLSAINRNKNIANYFKIFYIIFVKLDHHTERIEVNGEY